MRRGLQVVVLVLLWGLLLVLLTVAVFGEGPERMIIRRQLRELDDPSDVGPCATSASTTAPLLPAIVVVSASPDQVWTAPLATFVETHSSYR